MKVSGFVRFYFVDARGGRQVSDRKTRVEPICPEPDPLWSVFSREAGRLGRRPTGDELREAYRKDPKVPEQDPGRIERWPWQRISDGLWEEYRRIGEKRVGGIWRRLSAEDATVSDERLGPLPEAVRRVVRLEDQSRRYLRALWELSGGERVCVLTDDVDRRTGFGPQLSHLVLRQLIAEERVVMPSYERVMMTETEYLTWSREAGS